MAKCLVGAAGGLTASDKAKLVPENLRDGVVLFEGTQKEIVGIFDPHIIGIGSVFWPSGGARQQVYDAEFIAISPTDYTQYITTLYVTIKKDFTGEIAYWGVLGKNPDGSYIEARKAMNFREGEVYTFSVNQYDWWCGSFAIVKY